MCNGSAERSFSCEIYWTNSCFHAQLNSVSMPHPFLISLMRISIYAMSLSIHLFIYPSSTHFLPLTQFRVARGWSLSQLSQGERQNTYLRFSFAVELQNICIASCPLQSWNYYFSRNCNANKFRIDRNHFILIPTVTTLLSNL